MYNLIVHNCERVATNIYVLVQTYVHHFLLNKKLELSNLLQLNGENLPHYRNGVNLKR